MSRKFRVGEPVFVKSLNKEGTVKSKEVIRKEDSKEISVEYVIKLGEGFTNWISVKRDDLEKIKPEPKADTAISKVYELNDGYKLTLYADVKKNTFMGVPSVSLKIGYSICCPDDTFEEKIGRSLAKRRANVSPYANMISYCKYEFKKETVEAIMDVKANYIKNNLHLFLNKKDKK